MTDNGVALVAGVGGAELSVSVRSYKRLVDRPQIISLFDVDFRYDTEMY